MKTKNCILLTIFLVLMCAQSFSQQQARYILYGQAKTEGNRSMYPIYFSGRDMVLDFQIDFSTEDAFDKDYFRQTYSTFQLNKGHSKEIWCNYDVQEPFNLGVCFMTATTPQTQLGRGYSLNDVRFLRSHELFMNYLFLGTSMSDLSTCTMLMSVCPDHKATIKPLKRSTFSKEEVVVLEAVCAINDYVNADFVWEYSLDGIHFSTQKANTNPMRPLSNRHDFVGKTLHIAFSDIPDAKFNSPIYFRLKYCDSLYYHPSHIPSDFAVASPPVSVSFFPLSTQFEKSLYRTTVRCPNEAPQPLSVLFNRTLKPNEKITGAYLYQNVDENQKPLDRIDLGFLPDSNGLTLLFNQGLSDGDYFLQVEGTADGINMSSLSTTIRVQNPEDLKFETDIVHSSGTEYYQDIPKVLNDGKITVSVKNYLDDCSIFLNKTEYKKSNIHLENLPPEKYLGKIRFNHNQCEIPFSASVEIPSKTLHVRIEEGSPISCQGSSEASLQAIIKRKPANEITLSWYKNGHLLLNENQLYLENLSVGKYSVICESEGLKSTFSFVVSEPEPLKFTVKSESHPLCYGSNNGHIHIEPKGGTPPYHYVWSHGETSKFADQLSAGTYSVTISDQHNCSTSYSTILHNPSKPLQVKVVEKIEQSYSGSELGVVKPSENTGLIRIAAEQGTPPYTYQWSNGSTNNEISNLSFGTFHATIRDFNSCEQTISIELPQRLPLTATVQNIARINCFESNDAILQASVEGGIPPYRYRWKHNNDTVLQQTDLAIGTYEFEVTDSRGVRSFDRIYVSQPEPLNVVLSADSVSGWGASDGSIQAVASGGTPPYTFEWGCSTAASVEGLRAGTYHLRLTDANGCWLEDSISVETPDSLTLSGQAYPCTYFGAIQGIVPAEPNDGRIYSQVEGGVKPYSYQWFYQQPNNEWIQLMSKNTPCIDSLTGGYYALIVTDSKGYSVSDTFFIVKNKPLTTTISAVSPLCFGNSDGFLQAIVSGGIPPYSYRWNLGDSTVLLQGLTAGHYAVIVQDSLGVWSTFETVLTQPEPLVVEYFIKEVSGYELSNGAIFSDVQGGIKPYSYLWTNHDTLCRHSQITDIPAGIYTLQVTDSNGCQWSSPIAVNNPEILEISALSIKPVSYRGSVQGRLTPKPSDGELHVKALGGFPPYKYRWENGEKTSYLTGLSEGSYSVTVTDKNGNQAYGTFNITTSEPLMLTVTQDRLIACAGEYSATLTSHISGGIPPYAYLWSHGKITATIDSLTVGTYHLDVTDSLGISANFTIQIDEPAHLVMTGEIIQPQCPNPVNGAINLSVSGGVSPYQYRWNTFEQTSQLQNLSGGMYHVTATDANGCQKSQSFHLQTPLTAHIEQINFIRCFADSNATLKLNICGGASPYKIQWNTGDSTMILTGQKSGLYSATVTDSIGQVITAIYKVTEPEKLHIKLGSNRTLCHQQTLPIHLSNEDLTYFWTKNGSFFHFGDSVNLSETGEYTVIAENPDGCTAFDTIHIKHLPDTIDAEFWHSHEAVIDENFVVANIGLSLVDSVVWSISPSARVLSQNDEYLHLRFSDTGQYQIRLITYKNGCFKERDGIVYVMPINEHLRLKSAKTVSLSDLKLFPNPAHDQFNFSVQTKKSTTLHWTLTHVGTGILALSGQVKSDSNGMANQQISLKKQSHGVYVFRVFAGKEQLSAQLIIH